MVGHSKCLGGGREFRLPPLFFAGHMLAPASLQPHREGDAMSNLNTLCYERSIGGA
jgi:hypothetical protein